ncbi:MAG: LysM peptidoglycan-binding domain-containing protein [Chloroflexi bacterium]|nr:LysM peptidoglycan-binding domain-containing protein [Chloroflexota bacterium]
MFICRVKGVEYLGGIMRKTILFILALLVALLLLAACSQDDNGDVDVEGTAAAEVIPTSTATPTPTLPATYTPVPGGVGGHLYAVSTRSIHIVQPGDTLGKLANQYGVTVQAIANVNRIVNLNLIEVGDVLYIPPCE